MFAIIIGFRDWGLDRLGVSIKWHRRYAPAVDVIVVDYGSKDPSSVKTVCEDAGATVVRIDTARPWSRSRALNAGVASCRHPFVVTTDADIVFSPETYAELSRRATDGVDVVTVVQCWDLPSDIQPAQIADMSTAMFNGVAKLRPRWGMGGCCFFSRAYWDQINGFDERMEVWGGEDTDFCERARSTGRRIDWLEGPELRIYHIWHMPILTSKADDPEFQTIRERNRKIALHDKSILRNLDGIEYLHRAAHISQDVSVVIATHNRAPLLGECLWSIAKQSIRPREVLVIGDGCTDETARVVELFQFIDARFIDLPKSGISACRNRGTVEAKGALICVQDDDDLMTVDRIRDHLAVVEQGVGITYGGWIDFTEHGLDLQFAPALQQATLESLLYGPKSLAHGAAMYAKWLLEAFPYDVTIRTGTDFDLNARVLASGVRVKHTGSFVLLRRRHQLSVTDSDAAYQRSVPEQLKKIYEANLTPEELGARQVKGRHNRTLGVKSVPPLEGHIKSLGLGDKTYAVTVPVRAKLDDLIEDFKVMATRRVAINCEVPGPSPQLRCKLSAISAPDLDCLLATKPVDVAGLGVVFDKADADDPARQLSADAFSAIWKAETFRLSVVLCTRAEDMLDRLVSIRALNRWNWTVIDASFKENHQRLALLSGHFNVPADKGAAETYMRMRLAVVAGIPDARVAAVQDFEELARALRN